ncbi:MAG TPA: carboxypeptidase-like regulatory domain-containing protein [Candidatus Sumerlaeota bacterium]|nr:carboxypeptidase-like regulatory domain-containing protein [Candidatus Sumerlaeota bacterium]
MVRQALEYLEVVIKNAENLERAPRPLSDSEWNLPQSKGDVITGIDFVLQKDESLSGYLVDSEGKSVMEDTRLGVKRIQLVSTDIPIDAPEFEENAPVKPLSVDLTPEGHFGFPSVPVGTFRFKTLGEQGASLPFQTKPESLTVKPGDRIENLRVELDTQSLGTLDITVLNSKTREPIEKYDCGLTISRSPGERGKEDILLLPLSEPNTSRFEHKGGKAHFDRIPLGKAKLYIGTEANEFPQIFDIEIQKGRNTLDPVLFVPSGQIVGKVQEFGSEKPIEKFSIRIDRMNQDPRKSPDLPPGSFQIDGVSSGQKKVEISSDGYGPQEMEIEVKPGEATELTASLKPEGCLIGRITCEGKVASYGISTRLQKPSPQYPQQREIEKDGTFECKGLGEGSYDVMASCNLLDPNGIEYSVRQYDSFPIKAGEEVRKDFHFPENAGISGKIEFPDTVEKVEIGVCNDQSDPQSPEEDLLISTLETRQNRIPYEIRYLPPGTCNIIVFYTDATGRHRMPPKAVTLQPGRIETVNIAN